MSEVKAPSRIPPSRRQINVGGYVTLRLKVVYQDKEFGYALQPVLPSGMAVQPDNVIYLTREEIVEALA